MCEYCQAEWNEETAITVDQGAMCEFEGDDETPEPCNDQAVWQYTLRYVEDHFCDTHAQVWVEQDWGKKLKGRLIESNQDDEVSGRETLHRIEGSAPGSCGQCNRPATYAS